MLLSTVCKAVTLMVTAAGLFCLPAATPATAPNVSFTAAGTFGSTPTSGSDTLKLAGEPFTINIVANAASVPIQHGPNWAVFSPLKMTGQVHSGLLGATPVNIASGAASIEQGVGPDYDPFTTAFPVKIVGISLTVLANIQLPAGTLANQLIHPFAAVALSPTNATVEYSDGTNSTTLAVQTGTLIGALPKSPSAAFLGSPRIVPPAGEDMLVWHAANLAVLTPRRQFGAV